MAVIRMSESELARDLANALARVRQGDEVIIEDDHRDVAVIRSPESKGPGRKSSECIALAREYEANLGFAPTPDEGFAQDVQAAVADRQDAFDPPGWD